MTAIRLHRALPQTAVDPPSSFTLPHPFHRAPAAVTAKPLQWRTPVPPESHVAAGPVTCLCEKIFPVSVKVMTLAHPPDAAHAAAALPFGGTARDSHAASAGPCPTSGTAAGSSTATIAALSGGILRCSNVFPPAPAGTFPRNPSADTSASADSSPGLKSSSRFPVLCFGVYDLLRGSWERSLPDGSSLGAGALYSSPRRLTMPRPIRLHTTLTK